MSNHNIWYVKTWQMCYDTMISTDKWEHPLLYHTSIFLNTKTLLICDTEATLFVNV